MKRSGPLSRATPLRRSRRRLGMRATERRRAGGPSVTGRSSVSVAEWRAIKAVVWQRAGGRCEVVLEGLRCPRGVDDPEHVLACSAGGSDDPSNVAAVCRQCHRRTEVEYARGRLVITPLGDGRFVCRLVVAVDKFEVRRKELIA